jgi:hypothetical protein
MIKETIKKSPILYPLMGYDLDNDLQNRYIKAVETFERNCEKSLIETLSRLDIRAIVKTNPYSLPYNKQLSVHLGSESYLNGPYEFHRAAKKIVKELLIKDVSKVRFYIFIEIFTDKGIFGNGVKYNFRYYI